MKNESNPETKTFICPFCGTKMDKYVFSFYYHCLNRVRCPLMDANFEEEELRTLIRAMAVDKMMRATRE
jgi:ssDNA-binding Zn-finger/Zn-ribbon topoisomerase 1